MISISLTRTNGKQCLYEFSKRQQSLYDRAVAGMRRLRPGVDPRAVHQLVQEVIVKMLQGHVPGQEDPALMHELRFNFPILNETEMNKLPHRGKPPGDVKAVLLPFTTQVGGEPPRTKIARLDFTPGQVAAFATAMEEITAATGDEDEAFLKCANLVAALTAGHRIDPPDDTVALLAEHFVPRDIDDLPDGTAEDDRRLTYTDGGKRG